MTELKEEHFEVIDANRDREHQKSKYKPLPYDMFVEESMINGQGLFASTDIPKGTDLGVSHISIEIDKMSPPELIRTPLGGLLIDDELVEVSGPNCEKIKHRPKGNKTEWNLITRKDIKAGEELTLHYTFYKPE
jgi:SET domain-containing protein